MPYGCRLPGYDLHMTDQTPHFQSLDADDSQDVLKPPLDESVAPVSFPTKMRRRPTPHRSKLRELLENEKLPDADRSRVEESLRHYDGWIAELSTASGDASAKLARLVELLNQYKRHIELDLIWDSESDFLFRQRGQIKLDNSIIEEFLPWLADPDLIPELAQVECFAGPASAFAAAYFQTSLTATSGGIGLRVRTKAQDFTMSRPAYLSASFDRYPRPGAVTTEKISLAFLAAECKTNLDKTMFQEAVATAHDLKIAMPGSRYFIVCEYLDMTPINTASTDIDEVLILRGKRMGSNVRRSFSAARTRRAQRQEYVDFLDAHPIRLHVVERFVDHLRSLFTAENPDEDDVVTKGYF
jgi:hypothetical protein